MQDALLIVHFLGLALSVGTGFAILRLRLATKNLAPAEQATAMKYGLAIAKNGALGLGLLILSGVLMLVTRGAGTVFASGGPAFHLKLALVVVISGLVGYSQVLAKRIREKQDPAAMVAAPKVGSAIFFTGIAIVVSAVIAFH